MFCPRCANADQSPDTYCRQCGMFLPDFDKLEKKPTPLEIHLKANMALSAMTAVVSATLAILLFKFFVFGQNSAPPLIYITAGFLVAMFFWQAQTFWRTVLVKKLTKKSQNEKKVPTDTNPLNDAGRPNRLLDQSDLNDAVPPSIVEHTTKRLSEKIPRKR